MMCLLKARLTQTSTYSASQTLHVYC